MLGFIDRHYEHALRGEHREFLDRFRELDKPAQCLYVRLVNRKGRVFARNRLRYAEIGDIDVPLAALSDGGWIGQPGPEHFEDLLGFLTRAELIAALAPDFVGIGRSMRRADYVEFALEHAEAARFLDRLDPGRLLVQRKVHIVDYLLFLYFGRVPDGLAQFTMRDLGIVKTRSLCDGFEPRFNELEEAEEHFYFSMRLKRLAHAQRSGALEALAAEARDWPEPVYPGAASLRDRLAYRLGRALERADRADGALELYAAGDCAKCRERRVRLLFAADRKDEARRVLKRMLDAPGSDEEWLFAGDYYRRKFGRKRTSSGTDALRAAQTICLDEAWSGAAERGTVAWFEARGETAFRVENTLWRTLFGLCFWDELFGSIELHSPFERLPASLVDGSFYARHAEVIESRLASFAEPAAIKRRLLAAGTRHFGTRNGVFRWRRTTLDALFALVDNVDTARLAEPLRRLCRDYDGARHGYPDLLVIDADGARFVEIKAEGDQLRRNQLLRLEQLRSDGLRADVVRVSWTVDPAQEYVVVDVETTGGKGPDHRITEIGAVRVRGGRILERFQTLVNPHRPVPSAVTRLTGISQEMVAKAPSFSDIADEFADFLGDAVFVAHNVGFDYRFVGQEFHRLGRSFRHPKLCTCATMRRLFPGHRSYSLAALCQQFGIPLRQHHRALCDAEAAAELLFLINDRRKALLAVPQDPPVVES